MTNNPLVEALREARSFVPGRYPELLAKIDTALASSAPATGECEQFVAWLRTEQDVVAVSAGHELADCVERGDHRTQSGEMEGGEHG